MTKGANSFKIELKSNQLKGQSSWSFLRIWKSQSEYLLCVYLHWCLNSKHVRHFRNPLAKLDLNPPTWWLAKLSDTKQFRIHLQLWIEFRPRTWWKGRRFRSPTVGLSSTLYPIDAYKGLLPNSTHQWHQVFHGFTICFQQ